MERNFPKFEPVYNWFDKSLKIFTPQSINHGVEFQLQDDQKFTEFLQTLLEDFDPSVVGLKTAFVDPETNLGIPQKLFLEIKDDLEDRQAVFINNPITGNRMVLFRDEGEVKLVKIFTQHKCYEGEGLVTFDLEEESDGTRRLIELAPLFYELMSSNSDTVACIDELDRSLHPGITKKLFYNFLKNKNQAKSQLIVSTHDTNLLDTKLLRRDVIWFIHKIDGASKLTSLHKEFNPRHDKDIRREYLEGKYGSGRSYEYEL